MRFLLLLLATACSSSDPGDTVDSRGAPTEPPEKRWTHDTVFLVWIPYDNNLGGFVAPVIQGLMDGSRDGVEVFAQVDKPDQPGMQRATLAAGQGEVEAIEAEDSGSIEAFAAFLDAAAVRYEARSYGVVVMNHGGDLDHVARDDFPGPDVAESSWLSVDGIARELARFRREESGEVELLALQVCGKASIEPLRTLAPAARTLLASQLPLAAPNTWYRDGLHQIAAHPEWTGEDWVRAVASTDEPRMYAAVTCASSEALLAQAPLDLSVTTEQLEGPLASRSWRYGGETYVDLGAALSLHDKDPGLVDRLSCGVYRSEAPAPLLTDGFPDHQVLSGLSAAVRPDGSGGFVLDPATP